MAEMTSSEACAHPSCAESAQIKNNSVRKSRALLENYWASVQQSGRERPLYHTFSDRYGGTNGVRYASRMHKAFTAVPHKGTDVTASSVSATLTEVDDAIANHEIERAKEMLTHLLTFLQNWNGGLTLNELTMSVRRECMTSEYGEHVMKTLLCWSKVHMLNKDYAEALKVLNLTLEVNPQNADIYALRAACYEYMSHPQEAYEEYEKYLKLETPSLLIWAHCGKCAAESHNFHAAKSYLHRVITITENYTAQMERDDKVNSKVNEEVSTLCVSNTNTNIDKNSSTYMLINNNNTEVPQMTDIAFYNSLAHFFLGYAYAHEATTCEIVKNTAHTNLLNDDAYTNELNSKRRDELLAESALHYRIALDNTLFIAIYEKTVNDALVHGNSTLALQLLHYLQLLQPQCAQYHLQTYKIHCATHQVDKQLEALSAAIDCTEESTIRNVILLARGVAEAELLLNYENAIRDFSLVIESTIVSCSKAYNTHLTSKCMAMAYLKRAQCYLKRQRLSVHSRLERKADEDAILTDYHLFLTLCDTCDGVVDNGGSISGNKSAHLSTVAMWCDDDAQENNDKIETNAEIFNKYVKVDLDTGEIADGGDCTKIQKNNQLCACEANCNDIKTAMDVPNDNITEIYNTYFAELLILDDTAIVEALIALAIGAQKNNSYALSTLYFSRALLSGWLPCENTESNPVMCSKSVRQEIIEFLFKKESAQCPDACNNGANSVTATMDAATRSIECTADNKNNKNNNNDSKRHDSSGSNSTTLLHLMYITFAQHIIQIYPVAEDMFKVQYDVRDFSAQSETRKFKNSEKRDGERVVQLALPCMEYIIVDQYYTEVKNKASSSELCQQENQFILLWEPYRSEVERIREEALATRPGKRGKRHIAM